MAFDKPYDFAWMFVVFALVMVVAGLGVQSANDRQGAGANTSFFTSFETLAENSTGLKGAADAQRELLEGNSTGSSITSTDGFLLRSWKSMTSLSKTFSIMEQSIQSVFLDTLGLPPIIWLLVTSAMLITFGVIMYAWLRGN